MRKSRLSDPCAPGAARLVPRRFHPYAPEWLKSKNRLPATHSESKLPSLVSSRWPRRESTPDVRGKVLRPKANLRHCKSITDCQRHHSASSARLGQGKRSAAGTQPNESGHRVAHPFRLRISRLSFDEMLCN